MDIGPETRTGYRSALSSLARFLSGGRFLDERAVLDYRDSLLSEGKAAGTVNQYISSIKQTLEHIGVTPNPARSVRRVRQGSARKKDAISADDARRVVDSVTGDDLEAKRDRALLDLLLRAGLRLVEVHRADVGDVRQMSGRTVLFVRGKGRVEKDEFVLLTEEALAPLRDYLGARGALCDSDPLFAGLSKNYRGRLSTRSLRKITTRYLVAAGVKSDRVTAHSTRHTTATLALLGGAPIRQVQKLLRHASVRTTERYAHDLERLMDGAESCVAF